MKKLIRALFALLPLAFACGAENPDTYSDSTDAGSIGTVTQPVADATLKGTITYRRNWTDCDNTSRMRCDLNGVQLGYGPIIVGAIPTTGGTEVTTTTNSAGQYSLPVQGGLTYQLRSHNRDGSLGTGTGTSNFFGTASVAFVVNNHVNAMQEIVDNIGSPVPVATGATVTFNPQITSGSIEDRAIYYMMSIMQRDVWLSPDFSTTLLQSGHYRVRIQSISSGSNGGDSCNPNVTLPSFDCVMTPQIATNINNNVLLHETGHGIQTYVQLATLGRASNYDAVNSCVTVNGEFNAGSALIEGWADYVQVITKYFLDTVPPFFNGQICASTSHPPATGPMPNAPACGTGAIAAARSDVTKGFVDLVDLNTVVNPTGCRNEQLQVKPFNLILAWTKFTTAGTKSGCGQIGLNEGGTNEGSACGFATPNFPYTGTNALPVVDGLSYLDLLGILKTQFGVSGSALFDNWANTGWARGDSATVLP